jgi:hypothetical protein
MNKLELYVIERNVKTLIVSYLTDRYKKETLIDNTDNNSSSKWEMIINVVHESSILGPPFFLHYIKDLPIIITKNNGIVLFAEDTSLVITGLINQTLLLILTNHSTA